MCNAEHYLIDTELHFVVDTYALLFLCKPRGRRLQCTHLARLMHILLIVCTPYGIALLKGLATRQFANTAIQCRRLSLCHEAAPVLLVCSSLLMCCRTAWSSSDDVAHVRMWAP